MKRILVTLLLIAGITLTSCNPDSPTNLPSPPSGGNTTGGGNTDKEPDDEPEQEAVVVNGTTIADSTTLYGLVTDAETGEGIKNIVVSDGFTCTRTDKNGVYQIVRNRNSEMVNVSVPAEYEIPVDVNNLPAFYKRFIVNFGETFRHDFSLTRLPGGKQTQFTMLMLADIQAHDVNDTERFINETIPDINALAPTLVNPYAMTLGDITNKNNSAIWSTLKRAMQNGAVTYFQCMGNHDHLNELSPNDHSQTTSYWKSVENFHKYFGPQNYSFDRGDVHFVVIDTCLHGEKPDAAGATHEYATGLYDWGYEWFLQDLSFVPKNKMVVLCCHIPFRDGGGDNHSNKRYRKEILNKLSEYKEAHLMIGHTHHSYNWIHTVNGRRIHEHIHGTVCGQMWHGPFCTDGTPNGYGVYEFDGATLKNFWYKGTGLDKDFQMRCYDGGKQIYDPRMNVNMTEKRNVFSSYSWNLIGNIVANIWNIEHGEWEVSLWQNGEKVCDMTKMDRDFDYYALYWFCEVYGSKSDTYQKKSYHLYKGALKDPSAPFEVRAVDKLGRRGPYICDHITTNYDGLNGDFETYVPTN
ncbi:MAG: calcineurin-like phosphoesterase C-terminal domain-containing protein [Alistipes sp.]|nr:calcineurin-like phosphoesterase C-terminal domain-containing protein [Alistipes sp.]